MDKKRGLISAICVLIALFGLIYVSTWKDFDAKGYVQAVLNQTFQGEVTAAAEIIEGATEEELFASYKAGVESFMDQNILSGVEVSDQMREQYYTLCENIFKAMKYEVTGIKKVNRKEFEVSVTYYEADIIPKFVEAVNAESKTFLKDAANNYTSTNAEENQKKMEQDFLQKSYELLEAACQNVSYGDGETMIFHIKSDENHIFSADESQISEFIVKILMLDEIPD